MFILMVKTILITEFLCYMSFSFFVISGSSRFGFGEKDFCSECVDSLSYILSN